MKFQIKSRFNSELIFEADTESLKLCVELAVKNKINLRSANLSYADLSSANLSYADLRSADLRSADLSSANLSYADLRSADLSYADLSYADLRSADLNNIKYYDLMCVNDLQDAIDLAPMIFDEWNKNGIESAQKRFGMYKVGGENRALILMCPRLVGGYCFVLEHREIWWWSWSCPERDDVPILWRESNGK